ncbi:MAG: glycosyltransferase family 2 protein [Myxococcales bacterium]|nr:MAG: glycosyltransferase family 2 protein [Myxococcales bacterium]
MLQQQRVAVVVPAYCEERLLGQTLSTMPAFVDAIYVVDDGSPDDTSHVAKRIQDSRLRVIRHETNRGVGAAIVTGYRAAFAEHADVVAVMAGDAQMCPNDLPAVLEPVLAGRADYVKGNRFRSPERRRMPWPRRLAGKVLSVATRLASGLSVDDCQCGFTGLGRRGAALLPLEELWPGFGYPNDLLLLAAQHGLRVTDVTVRPIYADERSGVRPWHALLILKLLVRRALRTPRPVASGWGRQAPRPCEPGSSV